MKDIRNYEGLYAIEKDGRVFSYLRNKWLKPVKQKTGYFQYHLYKDGKMYHCYIHRLVAQAYLDNPDNLPEVNHKDENKANNHVSNLEWVSASDNANYGTRSKRIQSISSKPVYCVELDKTFINAKEAAKTLNLKDTAIRGCCKGKVGYKTAGGYHWQYVENA